MNETIQYVGEHLWPGRIGHFAVVLSFIASLLCIYSAYLHKKHKSQDWKRLVSGAFITHALAVFTVIATLFYIIINRYYEYRYAFAHSSDDLPFEYIFSAFWEDQEGSFLLWMFWHAVLGLFILWKGGRWKWPILFFLSLIQGFLSSMLLGVHIPFLEDTRLGVSPFILLRHTMDIPIFQNAAYVSLIDGQGLNPLLQNYWNVIHPPTLFLGFASTSIPFCYAMSGLWYREYTQWLKPAFPWALFSMMILGTGLLMGSFWAYEALNFGGYWAWDPVENASLVPWILGIAGIHSHLIARSTGRSIGMTAIMYALCFLGILYSTFLTRSGVLEDTSVHAFTELGLETQLTSFILFFIALSVWFIISRRSELPKKEQEERSSSREFWMVLGIFTLILSTVLISFTTSIPLINKMMDGVGWLVGQDMSDYHRSSPIEVVTHYNKFQLWIAVLVILLSAFAQVLRWKQIFWQRQGGAFFKEIGLALLLSIIAYFVSSKNFEGYSWQYHLLLGAAWFGFILNGMHLFWTSEKRSKIPAIIAHSGFAIMVLGILWSGLKQHYVSTNPFVQRGLIQQENLDKNVLLYKGTPLDIDGYRVTYIGDTIEDLTRTFFVKFGVKNKDGEIIDEFISSPNVLYTKTMDKIAAPNPSTRHTLTYDVFNHIVSLPVIEVDGEARRNMEDSLKYDAYSVANQETFYSRNNKLRVLDIYNDIHQDSYTSEENDVALGLTLAIGDESGRWIDTIYPGSVVRGNIIYRFPDKSNPARLQARIPDSMMESVLSQKLEEQYDELEFSLGQKQSWNNYDVIINSLSQSGSHPQYDYVDGDLIVSGEVSILNKNSSTILKPLYVIRGGRVIRYPAYDAQSNIKAIISAINPEDKQVILALAHATSLPAEIDIEIAGEVPRDDFIVLESIIFPGINMFWLGTIMMLIALTISMFRARKVN